MKTCIDLVITWAMGRNQNFESYGLWSLYEECSEDFSKIFFTEIRQFFRLVSYLSVCPLEIQNHRLDQNPLPEKHLLTLSRVPVIRIKHMKAF
jgi:hypothetical protein